MIDYGHKGVKLVDRSATGHSKVSDTEIADAMAAVTLEKVRFAFRKSDGTMATVLDSLTFQLDYHQVVGIVGRNAAGKSTLLNVVRGELVPQSGKVVIGGSVVSNDGRRIRTPIVSLVSQRPDSTLAPSMTVYENFVIASRRCVFDFTTAYSRSAQEACAALLSRAKLGLETKLHEQVRFLSGGQQQALSILMALKSSERVLLMDEPTASLDPVSSVALFDFAIREARSSQALVLVVSHRLKDLVEYCDRILLIEAGQVLLDVRRNSHDWNEESLLRHLIND